MASSTPGLPGTGPMSGSPSGVIGRGPIHSCSRLSQSAPRRYGRAGRDDRVHPALRTAVLLDVRATTDGPAPVSRMSLMRTLREEFRGGQDIEGGFSLLRASERLGMHRNTLLYRLDKIEQLSGQRVREPGAAIGLYLACLGCLMDSRHESGPTHRSPFPR
ncbi:helix-turn-helix domain-containing protein [Streptomyces sp. NPDC005408]|uniref:helix-turn-helix domain-containing protein n=1 Tax=Streptomyces sp. NPDC005408 TaxID=3155341 RepID=UPI0033B2C078